MNIIFGIYFGICLAMVIGGVIIFGEIIIGLLDRHSKKVHEWLNKHVYIRDWEE